MQQQHETLHDMHGDEGGMGLVALVGEFYFAVMMKELECHAIEVQG